MLKFCLSAALLGGILFSVAHEASAGDSLDEVKARLTALEDNQKAMREGLLSFRHSQERDISNLTQFCQDLEARVEQQAEVLQNIQESLEGNPSNPATTQAPDLSGPCAEGNYEVIDDVRRSSTSAYSGYDEICDRSLNEGWYRFKLQGNNAVMPTGCVPENRCTTDAPVWLDLRGQPMPGVGQEASGRGCANWVGDCCNWETPVTVRNCGDFLVYRLTPTPVCDLAFCAQPADARDHFNTERPVTRTTARPTTSYY